MLKIIFSKNAQFQAIFILILKKNNYRIIYMILLWSLWKGSSSYLIIKEISKKNFILIIMPNMT